MGAGRLQGKRALVTGAASGIGRAVASRFVAEGAQVVFADRDLPGARSAVAELLAELPAELSGAATAVEMDVTDESSVAAAYARTLTEVGPLDVVVANAGVQLFGHDAPIAELDLEVWQRTIGVNLTGTFLTLKHAVRAMTAAHGAHDASNTRGSNAGGSIICTGSPTGLNGEGRDFTAYSHLRGRRPRAGAYRRCRLRPRGDPGEQRRARIHRDSPGDRHLRGRSLARRDRGAHPAGSGLPPTWKESWSTWPATKPPSPRERSSASTVG